jgi:hypothetical protein
MIVHVWWEGPVSIGALERARDATRDFGVYQVYGSHPIYGPDTLLYIGQARDQTFAVRILQEKWWWREREFCQGEVRFFLGRLYGPTVPDGTEWENQISRVERLLIYAHKPSYNSSCILELGGDAESTLGDLHVLNWGCFGRLLPEISTDRWAVWRADLPGYSIYVIPPTG